MLTRPSLRPAIIVGVVVAATTWFASRAGDLNPPKGPIQPTMVSLEDLYNRISTQGGCPTCVWQYKYVGRDTVTGDGSTGSQGQVLVGSGTLHAVVVPGYPSGGIPRLFDHVGPEEVSPYSTIAQLPNISSAVVPTTVVFDVRFSNGIFVSGIDTGNPGGITLIYRLDP